MLLLYGRRGNLAFHWLPDHLYRLLNATQIHLGLRNRGVSCYAFKGRFAPLLSFGLALSLFPRTGLPEREPGGARGGGNLWQGHLTGRVRYVLSGLCGATHWMLRLLLLHDGWSVLDLKRAHARGHRSTGPLLRALHSLVLFF